MKINDTLKTTPGLSSPAAGNASARGTDKAGEASSSSVASTNSAATAATDNVTLSSTGQAMAASSASGASAVFDTKKVERIKLAIADGQFQVNSEKVADGLLDTVKDLLHSRKR